MSTATQANRQLAVYTPLGSDKLLLRAFSGTEAMSRLFHFELDMFSLEDWIEPDAIVGKRVAFRIMLADNRTERFFNGHVIRFRAGSLAAGFRAYEADVVPWFWFLTQTADCRIFQNQKVPEIIEKVFGEYGFKDYELKLSGSYEPWDYCVQYRETDFNFLSRLMEQEGIFYWFRHEKDRHVLVLGDSAGAYFDCPESKVDFQDATKTNNADAITAWEHQFEFTSGKWSQTDYNFIKHPARAERSPAKHLLRTQNTIVKITGNEKFEIYDYPGEFDTVAEATSYTKVRMEEEEATHDVATGASTCKTFTIGGKFAFAHHQCKKEVGKAYLLTSIRHSAIEPSSYELEGGGPVDYSNSFDAIPASVAYRPMRLTPKPMIHGSQTAVVTGPDGEEIYTDTYGRVKVQFYWDREGKRDDKTSCWIRCAQISAGKSWGAMFIPRIGQEVVVTFLEGDPDCPLITGVVYNAEQMPPYELPAEMTKSYIKTNSSKGGDGYNELRFEDKKDKEQIFIHAQRNMDVRVRNDSMERIYGNRHQVIGWEKDGKKGGDQRERVWQDKHLNVKRNQIEHIEGNYQLMVGNGEADDGGKVEVVIEKQAAFSIGNDGASLTITGDRKEKVDGTVSLTIGKDQQTKITGKCAVDAGAEIHLKSAKIIVEGSTQVSLKVGGNFVTIDASGVAISGTMVLINSGGAAGSGSGAAPASPTAPGEAAPTDPAMADSHKSGEKSTPY